MSGVITISCLGKKGRAGNSFFQWAFAKGYAKAMGAALQTPDWFGRRIFPEAAAEPLIDRVLPQTKCDSACLKMGRPLDYFVGNTNIDLDGYYQHQTFLDFYSRKQVREWFTLDPSLAEYSPHERGSDPYSAKHLRRGDYTTDHRFSQLYCTVSDRSYDHAIKTFNIPAPVIPVFEGCVPVIQTLVDLGVPWLSDWLMLRDADHLLRSNSTFAWFAAACGHGRVYSPIVEDRCGLKDVAFIEGNWPNTAGVFRNQSNLHLKEE